MQSRASCGVSSVDGFHCCEVSARCPCRHATRLQVTPTMSSGSTRCHWVRWGGVGAPPRLNSPVHRRGQVRRSSSAIRIRVHGSVTAAVPAQISVGGGLRPIWAADGKRIYFWEQGRLMSATLARDPALRVMSRDALFDGRYQEDFDVARDGTRFLMIESESFVRCPPGDRAELADGVPPADGNARRPCPAP